MQKVAIFGSQGFLGSHLSEYLLACGYQVLCVDSCNKSRHNVMDHGLSEGNKLDFVSMRVGGNVAEIHALLAAHQVHHVINCMDIPYEQRGMSAQCLKHISACDDLASAVCLYFRGMSENLRCGFKYILVSSYSIYGSCDVGALDERSNYAPSSIYAAALSSIALMAHAYHKTQDLPVITMVASTLYGIGHTTDVVGYVINRIQEGKTISLFGNGRYTRDLVYVPDFCIAIEKALQYGRSGESYCIGSGSEITAIEAASVICEKMNMMPDGIDAGSMIKFEGGKIIHDKRRVLNCAKANKDLCFVVRYSFDLGVSNLLNSYKALSAAV